MSGRVIGRFFCAGQPRTKGSMTPQLSRGRGGRLVVHLVESGEYAVPWKKKMIRAIREQCPMLGGAAAAHSSPVEVLATFVYERPEVGVSLGLEYPTLAAGVYAQGDLDKLLRNLLDALTQSGLIKDDSLVVKIASDKQWASARFLPGVHCVVTAL